LAAVWLRVRIDAVPTDPEGVISEPDATAAAQEAVFNALKEAEQEGFDHDHDDAFALTVDYVEVSDFDATV
jgi:hypothetical protein